jgi:hypothetical protein
MNSKGRLCAWPVAAALVLTMLGSHAEAYLVTLDFDSVDTPGGVAPADPYLAGYGISISDAVRSDGTPVPVLIYAAPWDTGTSHPNILDQPGNNGYVKYTLNFPVPLDSISFTRPQYDPPNGVILPWWRASALSAQSQVVSQVGDSFRSVYGFFPATTFTLSGSGITSLRVESDNRYCAAFGAMHYDDMVLSGPVTPSVPEPASCALLAVAVGGVGMVLRRGKRR